MKNTLYGLIVSSLFFASSAFAEAQQASATAQGACSEAILANRDFLLDKPAQTLVNRSLDSAVLTASAVASVPTLGATLPAGIVFVAAHNIAASAIKQGRVAGQERLLNLLQEASQFIENDQQSLASYPNLKELWLRVNGPVFKKIEPRQVAESVLKAEYDVEFCSQPDNFRLVHFKDYVLREAEKRG